MFFFFVFELVNRFQQFYNTEKSLSLIKNNLQFIENPLHSYKMQFYNLLEIKACWLDQLNLLETK